MKWKTHRGSCVYICSVVFADLFLFAFCRKKLPATERVLEENYNRQESRAARWVGKVKNNRYDLQTETFCIHHDSSLQCKSTLTAEFFSIVIMPGKLWYAKKNKKQRKKSTSNFSKNAGKTISFPSFLLNKLRRVLPVWEPAASSLTFPRRGHTHLTQRSSPACLSSFASCDRAPPYWAAAKCPHTVSINPAR